MAEGVLVGNKRRIQHESPENPTVGEGHEEARKRRAFLQTMGQQLREFGSEGTSPQDHTRNTFGTSPGTQSRPAPGPVNIAANTASSNHENTPENDAAPGEDDQVPAGARKSASKWLWRANEVIPSSPGGRRVPFTFEDVLDWSQSYFDHWHPAFPFLHAPSLLDHFRDVAQRGAEIAGSSSTAVFQHVILRSVMSISVVDRRQMSTAAKALPSTLVFHSFNDAINSIQQVLTDESSILSLQALVSVQLFLITMHRYNAASRLEGLAVRIAYQLGLHRCPSRMHSIAGKEAELRKRLFWSIFCIDRYICIRLGTPIGIRSDDIDVCYPHSERHTKDDGEDQERDNRLDLLEFLSQHANIRGSIMANRNKSSMRGGCNEADRVLEMEAEHAKWWNTVDEYLSNYMDAQPIIKAHQITLIILRHESVLALHRSVLATSKKNAAYNAALQQCIFASRSIINTLHRALQGFGAFDGSPGQHGYESTPLLWPSFTWAIWMSAFIIVFAAAEGQVPRHVALRLTDRSLEVLKHLALRGTSWPEACTVAIQNLISRLNGASSRDSTIASGGAPRTGSSSSRMLMRQTSSQPDRRSQPEFSDARRIETQPLLVQGPPRGATTEMLPPGVDSNLAHNHHLPTHFSTSPNLDGFNFLASAHSTNIYDTPNFANAYLSGSGTFLGIAQQTSDNPLPNDEIMHLFNGEDAVLWSGCDLGFGPS